MSGSGDLLIEAVEKRPVFKKIEGVSQLHGLPQLLSFGGSGECFGRCLRKEVSTAPKPKDFIAGKPGQRSLRITRC
jgi:hypothetical protein